MLGDDHGELGHVALGGLVGGREGHVVGQALLVLSVCEDAACHILDVLPVDFVGIVGVPAVVASESGHERVDVLILPGLGVGGYLAYQHAGGHGVLSLGVLDAFDIDGCGQRTGVLEDVVCAGEGLEVTAVEAVQAESRRRFGFGRGGGFRFRFVAVAGAGEKGCRAC